MFLIRFLKQVVSGRHRLSRCWMGFHRWNVPGGHCTRCGRCDDMLYRHDHCRERGVFPKGYSFTDVQDKEDNELLLAWHLMHGGG